MLYIGEEKAEIFDCPECSVRLCTGCQEQAHDGMTCAMLRSEKKGERTVDQWVAEDKENRMACPGCR